MRLLLPLALLAAAPAAAQDTAPPPAFDLSGGAGWLTDFRFRGLSRSDRDPTVQGSLRVDHLSGAFAAARATATSGRGLGGADAQVELSAGWAGNRGGWRPELGVTGYLFPGARGADFAELTAALARDIGPLSAAAGLAWAPPQGGAPGGNLYSYGQIDAGVPGTPVTLTARVGRENGAFAREKLDWAAGAAAVFGPITASLRYVAANRGGRLGGAGVVFGVSAGF